MVILFHCVQNDVETRRSRISLSPCNFQTTYPRTKIMVPLDSSLSNQIKNVVWPWLSIVSKIYYNTLKLAELSLELNFRTMVVIIFFQDSNPDEVNIGDDFRLGNMTPIDSIYSNDKNSFSFVETLQLIQVSTMCLFLLAFNCQIFSLFWQKPIMQK